MYCKKISWEGSKKVVCTDCDWLHVQTVHDEGVYSDSDDAECTDSA